MQSKLEKLRQLTQESQPEAPEQTEEKAIEVEISQEEMALTTSSFEVVWKQYIEHLDIQGKRSLSVICKDAKWELISEHEVELTLASKHEHELFDEDRINILPFMRSRLKNFKLDFMILVNQLAAPKRVFTAEDKFKVMAEKNPLLNDLRNALGLEL
jgi:DNA polymerase-3 subunit gamma/tau